MAQSIVKCEICDKRECALICIDCDQYFCQKCKEGHIKTKTTKDHQFLDSGTFQPQYKKLRCTQHEHHFIFFCERCQTLVCPVCLPENHQEHRMLKINKVASIKKKELIETLKIFVSKLNGFELEVNSIQRITEKCKGENKDVIKHVDEQAMHIANVLENQRRCIIKSVEQKAKTEEKRISIIVEELQHCMKEAKELERKVKHDLQGSETSLLSNFQLRKSKLDTFEFNDTTISTCPVQFEKYNVPKEELSLLESVFIGNLCRLSEHEERNTLKNMMFMHDRKMKELQKELTNQIQLSRNTLQDEIRLKEDMVKANSATKYEELKKLQHQTEKLKTEKDRNLEEYHKVCKERDELKDGAQSIQKVFDEYDNTMRNMARSLEENEREHLSKQHTFSNQLKEKDIKITDLTSFLNRQKRLLSEKEETIIVIKKEKDDLQTRQQTLKQQLKEKENTISELNRMHTHHEGIISDDEGTIRVMKREKDDLQTRLSSVAGEKLTKGNPSITDLGDPNRPMKIGEKYGELYDNEWTDAMENIKLVKEYYPDMKDNEIEGIIIRHLQRLLKCCYGECLRKAEDQIQTLGKALIETMCLTFESKEEIESLPVCKEASVLRRTKSEDFAKFLVENKVLCNNTIDDWDYINKNGNVMQILMESTFFEKCVYLCWCMVIQDPVMYLDDDPIPCTPIDKNTYKEFVKSGDSVAYVVWPALFLHKGGHLLYKGVVQAYWKKDDDDNMEGTSV